jgi:glycine/D-amino acid oxidase-like deaminating enzyme
MSATDRTGYEPSWYTATMSAGERRGRLTFDLDVDVCVIGGGLAGLTTARELARRGWSVAVLEAERIAWQASGRNSGFVLPGFAEAPDRIIERVGVDHARALWALSESGVDYVRDTVLETGMTGVDAVSGWLEVSKSQNPDDFLARVEVLAGRLGLDTEVWSIERVRRVLKTDSYFHGLHFPRAFHIHPLNYALGLASAAEQAGARIFEDTPAVSIDPAGVRKRISAPSGRVRAGHIVLAGNTGLGALRPELAATVFPITTYTLTTTPLGERLADAVAYRGAVSDSQSADSHYRVIEGDRLLWTGRLTTWAADPQRYLRDLTAQIRRIYPQLGDIEVEHAWAGTMGFAVHKMPQIGEISPGLWLASAFGGQGINTSAMAGMLIARAIAERDQTWRLFSPYELVWAGGALLRAVVQVSYWTSRANENFRARLINRRRGRHEKRTKKSKPALTASGEEAYSPRASESVTLPDYQRKESDLRDERGEISGSRGAS